jgi:hypothetical protein
VIKPEAWRFREPLGPPLRRAAFAGIPVGGVFLLDIGLSAGELTAVGTGAFFGGFVAFDSPSGRTRAIWQLGAAVPIATGALVGALTGSTPVLAVATMFALATTAGITFAVSLRFYVAALNVTLALLIAQGLAPGPSDAWVIFLCGGAGVLLQAAFSLAAALADQIREEIDARKGLLTVRVRVRESLTLDAVAFRHALRFGGALAVGVAAYNVIDLGPHGYWVPMTILFVLRPSHDQTWERIAMRAAGTFLGLLLATPLAGLIGGTPVLEAVALGAAAALSWALLAIEYALFTTAITAFAVIIAHAFGQPALAAADERAIATVIGLVIVAVAYLLFRDRPEPAPTRAAATP